MSDMNLSDIAAVTRNGFGGDSGFFWIFALLLLPMLGGGGLWGNRSNDAMSEEILSGQKFDAVNRAVNQVGDGIASLGYSLQGSINNVQTTLGTAITSEGRGIQQQLCAINSNINDKFAAMEKSALEQRINEQSQQINQLYMAQQLGNVVKYPNSTTYSIGMNPYCNCGNTGY